MHALNLPHEKKGFKITKWIRIPKCLVYEVSALASNTRCEREGGRGEKGGREGE